jgi:GGDEF domain-containing protein
MATGQQQRSSHVTRDYTNVAWGLGGLGVVALVAVAFYGAGVSSVFAIAVAAVYAFSLSAALLRRNTRHWRRLLSRIEVETRRRLDTSAQVSTFSAAFFLERLEQECRRTKRYGLALSVIRLRCDAHAVAKLGAPDDAAAAVIHAAAAYLRSEDVVGRLSDLEYAFFLPHTPRAGAEVVLDRLKGLEDLVESLGLAVFSDDAWEPNSLLRAAGLDAERRLKLAETQRGWNQRAIVS